MSLKSENTSKIPELRFPEFHDEWTEKKLDNISKISSGGTPNRSIRPYWNGNIPWITTSLIDFNIIDKAEEYITEEGLSNSSAKLFPKETILMAMYGQGKTRGKVAILNLEASTNQACAAITLKKDVNTIFVFQYLIKKYERVRNTANDGGQKNLSAGLIKSIKISIPNLPEQQKIATFLTSIDERIQFLEKKKSRLEAYKKGVMQKIRFKDDAGNDFPDWEEKRLGEVCTFFSGGTPSSSNKGYYSGDIPFIGSGEIKNSITEKTINQAALDSSSAKIVEVGDLLYALYGATSGEVAISKINGAINQAVLCIRTKNIDKTFLFYLLSFEKENITNKYLQGGQGNLSAKIIRELQFTMPASLPEQQKIASFLTSIDKSIELIEKEMEGTTVFKKGLLQKMFV